MILLLKTLEEITYDNLCVLFLNNMWDNNFRENIFLMINNCIGIDWEKT